MPVIPKFPPIPENISVCDVQRIIQESVQDEVEKRMHLLRSAMRTPPYVPVPKSTFSPNTPFSHPALHERSSSSHQVPRDGMLNLAPLGSLAIHPARKPVGHTMPHMGHELPPSVSKPRNPSTPHLTPRVPEVAQQEDDDEGGNYAPRKLEECMMDAYNFNLNFHKRGIPLLLQEDWERATPARKAILTKRHQPRVRWAQQQVQVQRDVQWESLNRRAQRAAERGDVSNFLHTRPTRRAVVVGRKDYIMAGMNRQGFGTD